MDSPKRDVCESEVELELPWSASARRFPGSASHLMIPSVVGTAASALRVRLMGVAVSALPVPVAEVVVASLRVPLAEVVVAPQNSYIPYTILRYTLTIALDHAIRTRLTYIS